MAQHPIGYWVKQLDRLIEESFERAMAAEGLSRRHWQALNVSQPGSVSRDRLDQALAPFLGPETNSIGQIVDDLRHRGWVTESGAGLALTEAGQGALARLAHAVGAVRSQLMIGIADDQYQATVDTLSRMCANLERAAAAS